MASTDSPRGSSIYFIHRRRTPPDNEPWNSPRLDLYYNIGRDNRFDSVLDTKFNYPKLPNPFVRDVSVEDRATQWIVNARNSKPDFFENEPGAGAGVGVGAGGGGGEAREWGAAALGWAGGTLVLALFVLFVRATEKCLDKKFFRTERHQSQELQNPVAFATRNPRSDDSDMGSGDLYTEAISVVDLPPPYCECAKASKDSGDESKHCISCEEDPPSYSDCYVAVNPEGNYAEVYVYCKQGTETRRTDNTNVAASGTTNVVENAKYFTDNDLDVSDKVVPSGDFDTNNARAQDDAETKKADGTVVV